MRWQGVELFCLKKRILLLEVLLLLLLLFLLRCGGGEGREEGEEDGCCGYSRDEHLRIVSSKGRTGQTRAERRRGESSGGGPN